MSKENSYYLSHSEWDFDELIDHSEVSAAFFYEYARASEGSKKNISEWRQEKGNLENFLNRKQSKEVELQALPFFPGISFLALFPDYYPQVPYQDIPRASDGEFFSALKELFYPVPQIHSIEGFTKVDLDLKLSSGSYLAPMDDMIWLNPDSLNFVISVPRNLHGKALRQFISDSIGDLCEGETNTVLHADKIGLQGLPLGFGKRTALSWLGVLRRFVACNFTWKNFLEEYGCHSDPEDEIRKLQDQKGKAIEIIKWFDAGGRGKLVPVNKGRTLKWQGEG